MNERKDKQRNLCFVGKKLIFIENNNVLVVENEFLVLISIVNFKTHFMKKLILLFILLQTQVFSQTTIVNGAFENWTSLSYDQPSTGWYTSNEESIRKAGITTFTKVAGQSGFACRMETKVGGTDTLFGYITNTQGDPTNGEGGMPYSQKPTAITGYYRYNIPNQDTALILVFFKLGGVQISMDVIKVKGTGSQSTFAPFSFPLTVGLTPDTVIIAAVCSNAFSNHGIEVGSFLELDQLAFSGPGVTQPIPGGDFDTWTVGTSDKLNNWNVYGRFSKSGSSYSGAYAVKIETYNDGGNIQMSQLTNGHSSNGPLQGGQPFTNQVDTLMGYYKFTTSGPDTASVYVSVLKNGTPIGGNWKSLLPASSYTYFEVPINSGGTAPDTIQLQFSSCSKWPVPPGSVGSALYIDQLSFKSQPFGIIQLGNHNVSAKTYPNPVQDIAGITLNKELTEKTVLRLFDVSGRLVLIQNIAPQAAGATIQLNTGGLSVGSYYYEISGLNTLIHNKFIKD